ncbi:MAG: Serine-protein kinase RsbW [uncultured Solirubrobacteraceae bacterium]|uniref:Serine-protein kinase RsbW n=1 Tax=uncultured Solirubrobacteraceae bacterium TaxID=1162706 RepID=A0A6J4RRD9_9ACTN|nr:MAG: Serine-protein kinase RsbW [uncultured Solirubrobacteraceae bacterium]
MAVVELLLPAQAAHVRTARLVVVMAARRAGLSEGLLDELRLAVGEACARAVGLHARHGLDERVEVAVTDDVTGLSVSVTDHGPAAGPAVDDVAGGILDDEGGADEDAVDPDVSLALLAGLVDEVEVTARDAGTTVTMRWPLKARIPGAPKPTMDAPA